MTSPSPMPPSAQLLEDLVSANHILFDQGVVDGFGHVSARHDNCPDRFLLARNMAPTAVTPDDILQFGLDSEPLNANGQRVYLERYIHGEIYRAFSEVQAVVHSHSPSIVPLTVLKSVSLRPVFHMAGFIGTGAPVFDIRDVAGDGTDLLIRDRALGECHAQCFRGNAIVLMSGHGSTVVGTSLKQAVYRALYAEQNARFQLAAAPLGEVHYLSAAEATACTATH